MCVDWSDDPTGVPQQLQAAALGFRPTGGLTLSARVRVDAPRSTFDAGPLTYREQTLADLRDGG